MNETFDSNENSELKDIATSLKSCLNKTVSREVVLATFCNELEELLLQPFSDVLSEYKKVDVLIGEPIWVMPKFTPNAAKKAARALNIADDGTLVVRMEETGEVVNLTGEEVSIRLQ